MKKTENQFLACQQRQRALKTGIIDKTLVFTLGDPLKRMKKIQSIGFFINTTKANAAAVVEGVCTWLQARGIVPLLPDEQASALGRTPQTRISKTDVVEQADVLLVLGGDGTLLSAAHMPKIERVPILAINIGTLGFLTDASLDELYPTLESLLTGDYRIEHRMMLEVVVNSQIQRNTDSQTPEVVRPTNEPGWIDGEDRSDKTCLTEPQGTLKKPFRAFALNDVVIRHYTQLIELDAYIRW